MPKSSAGGVIVNSEGKLLLVQQHNNSWSFPKGQVEAEESNRQAALREIREETGFTKLEYAGDLGSYERYSIGLDGIGENKEWGNRTRTFFLFKAQEDIPPGFSDPDGEVTAVRFVTIDEALQMLTHPKDKEFLEKSIPKIKAILT